MSTSYNAGARHHMRNSEPDVGWRPLVVLAAYSSTLLLCFWFGTMVPPTLASEGPVEAAYNAGQLEYMSLMLGIVGTGLTVLGVVIAVSAVAGFWLIRNAAISAAERVAVEAAEKLARDWMNTEANKLVSELARLSSSGSAEATGAEVDLDPGQEKNVMAQATEMKSDPTK